MVQVRCGLNLLLCGAPPLSFVVGADNVFRALMDAEAEEIAIWELRQGPQILATIRVVDQDFPWNYGHICPTAAFESFRNYFRSQPNAAAAKAVREELHRRQITLVPCEGTAVREFCLIVDGRDARFQFA
jgi:hypothetical protein